MSIAASTAIGLGIAVGTATTGIYAANKQSGAVSDAANAQQQSNAAALAFQRQQAQNEYQNQEVTRHANYDQWAARQTSNNSVRSALGLKPIAIPGYVPSVDPRFSGGSPVNPAPSGAVPTGTPGPAGPAGANSVRSAIGMAPTFLPTNPMNQLRLGTTDPTRAGAPGMPPAGSGGPFAASMSAITDPQTLANIRTITKKGRA